jgi:large subunit ribosomal protein L9
MQVLLKENLAKVGRRGDVVEVKNGYARNYLLPRGIAVEVRRGDLASIESERASLAKLAEQERVEEQALADKLRDASVTISANANEEGHLFGSVGESEIAEAISAEVAPIDPSAVRLESHIKELGVYDVEIHVAGDINVTTKVWVISDQDDLSEAGSADAEEQGE